MINILVLAAGPLTQDPFDESYPSCMTEFDGKPVIEHIVEHANQLTPSRCFFLMREDDVARWHLDDILRMLAPTSHLTNLKNLTRGALCTALLVAERINNEDQLLILNTNDFLDVSFSQIIDDFNRRNLDAGTVVFPSVHPRYSYVRVNKSGEIIETTVKKPISNHATAGFYWFARGKDFVRSAQTAIRKDVHTDGQFYVCSAFNQLILERAHLGIWATDANNYHPLKSERQRKESRSDGMQKTA